MQKKLAILAALVLSVGLVGSAYAHKSEVIGNYKIEVGWKNEPPTAGKKNAIEITVTKAVPSDKKSKHDHGSHDDMKPKTKKTLYDQESHNIKLLSTTKDSKHKHDEKTKKKPIGVSGLDKSLEVDVTLNGKKTFLKLIEDKKNKGTYYGEYTPDSEGFPTVHIVGKILNTPIEMTFHPEKVLKS